MSNDLQTLATDLGLVKSAMQYLSQRTAFQEQQAEQLRQAQKAELQAIQACAKQLEKLKAEIKVLSLRQTAMEDEGRKGQEDEGLPLLLKNSGKKSGK